MAKIFSSVLETRILRALCSGRTNLAGVILRNVDKDSFHDSYTSQWYSYCLRYVEQHAGALPRNSDIKTEPELDQGIKDLLSKPVESITTEEQLLSSLNTLEKYRKLRVLYRMVKTVMEHLQAGKVDVNEVVEEVSNSLQKVNLTRSSDIETTRFGQDSNFKELLKEMIYEEDSDMVIPTGFDTFDKQNGGFFRGSLVIIGGNSGGGKSILCNQLAVNQAKLGYNISLAPLEMSTKEMVSRTISSTTGRPAIDIFLKRLSNPDKDDIYRKMIKLSKEIEAKGGSYTIFKPKEDLTIQQLLSSMHTLKSDVIYIDYISLLKGVGGDDSWQKLGEVARYCKIYAENHNKVVVLLAQLSEEGKIRYSQAIKEHASLAWTFVSNADTRKNGVLRIELLKSRNQVNSAFLLNIDYAKTAVRDFSPEDLKRLEKTQKEVSRSRSGDSNSRSSATEHEVETEESASIKKKHPDLRAKHRNFSDD